MPEKIIRDPVHDVIAFQLEKPADSLLFSLLGSAELQRLRRIRQLGMASLAYPGADHSRYSHSLGVMETARKMLRRLAASTAIDEEEATVCLVCALLHDIGHGPFSHVFERVLGIDHETQGLGIIEDPHSQVHRILADHDRQLPGRVARFLGGREPRTFYHEILASQLDADRFDYLLRDNLMTGSRYGDYDLTWLLHALTIDAASGRLAVAAKGVSAVEAYLQSRYHMYRNVYFHKVVRGAEGMVKLALQRARLLAAQNRLPEISPPLLKILRGLRLSVEEFTDLDDVSVQHAFKAWAKADDPTLAGLCQGILYRRLFKTIDLTPMTDARILSEALAAAKAAVASAGGDADYELFLDEPSETPYESFAPEADSGGEILVRREDGSLTRFGEISPLTESLHRQLMFRRLHVAESRRDAVAAVLHRQKK